jgi:hypothetical protein
MTPRLRHAVGLPTPVADPTGESEHLGVLLAETLCIILQIVIMTDDVGVLVTRPGKGDIPHTELRQLGIGPGVVEQVGSRLAYALRRANPDTPVIDLDPVTGWPELRGRLHELNRVQFETGGLGPWLGAGRTHMAAFPEGGSVKTGVTR